MANKEDVESSREPLMKRNGSSAAHEGHQWMLYLSTFVAVCGSCEFGCCAAFSSPTQAAITKDLSLSLAEYSMFGSILTFGAMIGAITIGPIADFIGQKGAMRVSSAFCIAGWLAIYFAESIWPLDIGRLATGYGMGAFSYVVPVYIAEIAPMHLRGRLTAQNQLMICIGGSISYTFGVVVSWRALASIGLIPCAVIIFGLHFIPESPRWLALRGEEANVSQEAAEIQDYISTLEQLPKVKMLDLFQGRYSLSVIIGVGLMLCQQLGGINGVCFFVSSIFELAGFSSSIGSVSYALIQVVVTGIGAAVMDKAGRKALILISASGLVLGCVLTAISFFLKVNDLEPGAVAAVAVTGILGYIGSFGIGMGAVPWVVMSEIFPINIKGQAGSFATLVNWFAAWLCSYTFNFLMSWSSYGTFILNAAINGLAIVFVVYVVPETKGKP